jgi:hypothetical protein
MNQPKLYLLFLLGILVFDTAQSQQQADSARMELGLNATAFVNQYLDLGSGNGEFSSPYIFTFEHRPGKYGYRIGIGLDGDHNNNSPENDDPNVPDLHTASTILNTRAGLVCYKNLSRRWDLKYGCDIIYGFDRNKSWTEVVNLFGTKVTTTNSTVSWNAGIEPYLFAQFHLTNHFSVGTELLFVTDYKHTMIRSESTEFSQFNTHQESTSIRYHINPPLALFFIFRI